MAEQFHQGHALVIGVGADLPMTAADATRIANLLMDENRCAYPRAQVHLLVEDMARRDTVLDKLSQLANDAGAESTVVIYFSGHGIERPGYYLMPFGYSLHNLPETAISGAEFSAALQAIQARKLLILLDCCHSGGQVELHPVPKTPIPAPALDELATGSGRVVIASSRKDELSWAGRSSFFTEALIEGLAGYGAFEMDGYARVLDIALWVGRKVPERTQDRQHPIIKVNNLGDNFAVAWYAAGAKTIYALPAEEHAQPFTPESIAVTHTTSQHSTWQKMLENYRQNLLLIEERMSEFVEFTAIPLQLIRNRRQVETKIIELEGKLKQR